MTESRRVRTVLSALLASLVAVPAIASIGLPLTREALATNADVIVIGRVAGAASAVDPAVDGFYTYVSIQPTEVLKGAAPGNVIVIKQYGGFDAAGGVSVIGQARFNAGEEVLLFLRARDRDGSLFTIGLWQGKWSIEIDAATGQRVARKRHPDSGAAADAASLAALRTELAGRALDTLRGTAINTLPAETPRQSSPFVLNDPPVRWTRAVVPVNVEPGSQPGLPGGGLAQIVAAVSQWNAAGSGLTLQNGVRLPARCQSAAGTDILITFFDPCNEISDDPSLLAVAAVGFSTSGGHVINGQTFLPITDVVITTSSNPSAQALMTTLTCFQSTIAHELGHAIGIDHTPDPGALMFSTETGACFSGPVPLNGDDVAALLTIYPGAGVPPPTGGGTPGQPAVTNASAVGGTLQLAWTSGAGATPTSHRLDFFSGAAQVASLTLGAATTAAIPIPPGTTGSFSVRVTAISGSSAGPPSALFAFTIGGTSGGCTSAPAAPVVSGSIVAGTATVTWPAVPGASSYIISAGSAPGGSNLSPAANVGATTSVSASGLPAGFSAWVRVIAVNACGQSAPGDFFLSSGTTPPPAPTPPPTSPGGASISFAGGPNTCSCWSSPIRLEIDGATVGSMACSGTAGPFPTTAGAHTYRACDSAGCLANSTTLSSGGTLTVTLSCQ